MHIPIGTAHSWLRAEVDQLAAEIALVLWDVGIERGGQARIVPCGCFGVVIDKINSRGRGEAHLPS